MRILVADDEPIEREALRVLVHRHLPDVKVVGEAGTGRQAVEMAESLRPDVILMDIEMPGLSGLEALREIRSRNPNVRCLIISAYDHFHFAQQALRLGASDYLLKPVKRDIMIEVLERLNREIAVGRQLRQEELRQKEHARHVKPLAEAEVVSLLANGDQGERTGALLAFLGYRFEAGMSMVAGPSEAPGGTPADEQLPDTEAHQYLASLVRSLCTCLVGATAHNQTTVMIELEWPVDEYATRTWSIELAHRIRERVKKRTGVRMRIGIGEPCQAPSGLSRSHQQALTAYQFEGLSHKVEHFGDLVVQEELEPEPPAAQTSLVWRPTPAVLRAVELGKRHVNEHYADDVTLEQVAQEVGLTPYYYSKVFSRVAGMSLVDYLTDVRVEHAKRMLSDPASSIKEVGFAVGYNDPNYFSRVFKKVSGQTPTEFRQALGAEGGRK